MWGIFLVANRCRRAQPPVGVSISREVGLGFIRRKLKVILVENQQEAFLYSIYFSSCP